jgi:signal peptidase complex subunit 3
MDSYSNRASTLFTTFTTVLFTFAALNHLTYYFHTASPVATIVVSPNAVVEFSEYKTYRADQLKFEFEYSYDFSSEYNWNVNQLYLFVVASYTTDKNQRNEVVVHDKIIREKRDYKASNLKLKNKYMLRDEFKGLMAGKSITLSVRYQVMPVFGLLKTKNVPLSGKSNPVMVVPQSYTKK